MHGLAQMADTFIPTRHTLLSRLKEHGDEESWKQFFEIYWKLIYTTAMKAGLTEAEAQDVVQETIIALSKTLPEFKYDPRVGSFKGYLLKLTAWKINDQFRRRIPRSNDSRQDLDSRPDLRTDTMGRLADPNGFLPDSYWDEQWQRNLLEVARERVKRKVNPKHYQIFDLHVDQGWPAQKVASTLGVNRALVYLARHRITHLLRKEIKQLRAGEQKQNEKHHP